MTGTPTNAIPDESPFEPFDLSVTLGPNNVPWVSAVSRIGLVHGIPRIDTAIPPLEDLLDYAYDYRDAIQFAQPSIGTELSNAMARIVFGDPLVLELFQATRGAAADRGRSTLVRILASPHLASLPWELLPDPAARREPDRTNYLTLAADAHVMRLGRARTYAPRTRMLTPPLHLLIVLSSPAPGRASEDYLMFDIYEVKRSLLQELQPLIDSGLLVVDIEDRPTLENLRRRIGRRARGFQLFHYVGHALPDRLVMEDTRGRRADQDSARITEILRLCPDLRLVVFAGCETARPRAEPADLDPARTVGWRDLISLADRCVQDAAPLVVGMQAVLPFRTERVFTRFFYQGLASGYSVAEAIKLARGATQSDTHVPTELLEWSVPAVFLGGTEPGPLIDRDDAQRTVRPERVTPRVLKLDLRQSETRFFARDSALRQAVDVLACRAPERVLVVTGAAGVGKTMLIDRALEELNGLDRPPSHVLYVKASRLAARLDRRPDLKESPDLRGLRDASAASEAVVTALCEDIERVLRADGNGASVAAPASASVRWDDLVEKLTTHRFVLVIDEFEFFEERIEASFNAMLPIVALETLRNSGLLPRRLAPHVRRRTSASQSGAAGIGTTLLDVMIALIDGDPPSRHPQQVTKWFKDMNARLESLSPDQSPALVATRSRCLDALFSQLREVDALTAEDIRRELARLSGGKTSDDASPLLKHAQTVDAARATLERSLSILARRRSDSRIGVLSTRVHKDFLALSPRELFDMRIAHLTWTETWRWIRRNLPGLLRYGEEELFNAWADLGPDLSRWEELERRVIGTQAKSREFLRFLQETRSPSTRKRTSARTLATRRRGQRPLRIAIAGPLVRSRQHVAQALTRAANQHGVGGRVVLGAPSGDSALAVVIDEPSPFQHKAVGRTRQVLQWLDRIADHRPDIVLMDYGQGFSAEGYKLRDTDERFVAQRLGHRCLFVAAAGNFGPNTVCEPAVFPEVLAVGAIDEVGALRQFTTTSSRYDKPNLWMLDDMERLGFADAFVLKHRNAERFEGTGFAAFHAVVAATLTWSLLPDASPRELIALLKKAASADGRSRHRESIPVLTLEGALTHARYELIARTLQGGPCSAQTLAAVIGQELSVVEETLVRMIGSRRIRRISDDRFERFDLLD